MQTTPNFNRSWPEIIMPTGNVAEKEKKQTNKCGVLDILLQSNYVSGKYKYWLH